MTASNGRANRARDRREASRPEAAVQRAAALNVIFGSADPVAAVPLFAAGEDRAGA